MSAARPSVTSSSPTSSPSCSRATPSRKPSSVPSSSAATTPSSPAAIRIGPQVEGTIVSRTRRCAAAIYALHPAFACIPSNPPAHCAGNVDPPRHRRRHEEAVAALPKGLGPGALTARERRQPEPPGLEAPRGRGHHRWCRVRCDSWDLPFRGSMPRKDVRIMHLLIYGSGRLGAAIAAGAASAGWPNPTVVGRTLGSAVRPPAPLADVVVDASRGDAVLGNVADALDGGSRAFVIAATGWDSHVALVRGLLLEAGAAAVVAPNLSLGAALFVRLTAVAAAWYGAAGAFDPSIVEWHRAGKADRPSGTAREIARRIAAADGRWRLPDDQGRAAGEAARTTPGSGDTDTRRTLEVAAVRAGAAPGTHLMTFDGPGESVELRLTARDRTPYADGAIAAARWLVAAPRDAGLHPFDTVVDDVGAAPAGLHA